MVGPVLNLFFFVKKNLQCRVCLQLIAKLIDSKIFNSMFYFPFTLNNAFNNKQQFLLLCICILHICVHSVETQSTLRQNKYLQMLPKQAHYNVWSIFTHSNIASLL